MKQILFLGSLLFSTVSFAQLEAKIDTAKIKIGEPIRLTYKVPFSDGDKIQLQAIKDQLNPHIEVIEQKIDTVLDGNQKKIIHQLDLTSYDEGEFFIPTIAVEKNGKTERTPSFQINVQTIEIDTTQTNIHPIKPIMTEEYTMRDYWKKYWIYGIVALILFFIALVLIVLYIRSKSKNLKNSAPKTPYEEILLELKRLEAKKYLKRGEQKEHYTQVSYLLRRYIGKIYQFSALEILSDELITFIQSKADIIDQDKDVFKQFIQSTDLVKFAQQNLSEEQNELYRKWIREFVERIKPIDLPENDTSSVDQVTGEQYKKWDNS